jgi:hypothetical protein
MVLWKAMWTQCIFKQQNCVFMVTKISDSVSLQKTLELFLTANIISSYKEVPCSQENCIKFEIHFLHKKKLLQVTELIEINKRAVHSRWDVVINGILEGRRKGEDAEQRMYDLLLSWKRKHQYGVTNVFRGSEYSDAKVKADLVVMVDRILDSPGNDSLKKVRSMIYLQIKSSKKYQEFHAEKYAEVPSIFVNKLKSDYTLGENFQKICDTQFVVSQINALFELVKKDSFQVARKLFPLKQEYLKRLHQ